MDYDGRGVGWLSSRRGVAIQSARVFKYGHSWAFQCWTFKPLRVILHRSVWEPQFSGMQGILGTSKIIESWEKFVVASLWGFQRNPQTMKKWESK